MGQHAAYGVSTSQAGEYGADVILVAQPAGDARAQLRHDFIVNLRGALVDDQQGDVVLAQLAGDGAKGGLGSHLLVEQLVGFLQDDDQRARLLLACGAESVGALLPGLADAPG